MNKFFHISEDGKLRRCNAKSPSSCPIKNENNETTEHFVNEADGYKRLEELNEKAYGQFQTLKKQEKLKLSTEDGFIGEDLYEKEYPYHFEISEWKEASEVEVENLTPFQVDSIKNYTGVSYGYTNRVLCGVERLGQLPAFAQTEVKNNILAFDEIFKDSKNSETRSVFRGVSCSDALFKKSSMSDWVETNLKMGENVSFSGYLSTSLEPGVATSFSEGKEGLMFEILTDEGINVTSISGSPQECEVILPRDKEFTVVGMKKFEEGGFLVQLKSIN